MFVQTFIILFLYQLYLQTETACARVKRETTKFDPKRLEKLDKFHTELMKQKILAGLGVSGPPQEAEEWKVAFDRRNGSFRHEEDRTPAKIFDLHVTGTLETGHQRRHHRQPHKRSLLCHLSYNFQPHLNQNGHMMDNIVQAHLTLSHSLFQQAKEVKLSSKDNRKHLQLSQFNQRKGDKVVFLIGGFVHSLNAQTPHLKLAIALDKRLCIDDDVLSETPTLDLQIERQQRTHTKRTAGTAGDLVVDCDNQWDQGMINSTSINLYEDLLPCCRRRITVTVGELGWGNWVVAPTQFDSYYCLGRCSRYGSFAHEHTGGQAIYSDLMNLHNDVKGLGLTPCCSPVRFMPLSITQLAGTQEEVTQTLRDVIVSHCGCM